MAAEAKATHDKRKPGAFKSVIRIVQPSPREGIPKPADRSTYARSLLNGSHPADNPALLGSPDDYTRGGVKLHLA